MAQSETASQAVYPAVHNWKEYLDAACEADKVEGKRRLERYDWLVTHCSVLLPKITVVPDQILLPSLDLDTIARRYVSLSPYKYHYHETDGWSVYHGRYWKRVTEEELEAYVTRFAVHCVTEGKNTLERFKYSSHKVKDILVFIRNMEEVYLPPDTKQPCGTGGGAGRYKGKTMVSMANGLLDVTNPLLPELREFDHEYYTLDYKDYAYDENADCPRFLNDCLGTYFKRADADGNLVPDELAADWIFNLFKRLLLRDTTVQRIPCIIGEQRSGKGTIGRIIEKLVGKDNVTELSIQALNHRFGLENAPGKTVGIMWDAMLTSKHQSTAAAAQVLKSLSGNDAITVDRKGRKALDKQHLRMNVVVMANAMLDLRDPTGALAGRWNPIHTTGSYYGREDQSIEDYVIEHEIPGIFNRSLRASVGQMDHPSGEALTIEAYELAVPYPAFVREWCTTSPVPGKMRVCPVFVMWLYYCQWCKQGKRNAPGYQSFKARFKGHVKVTTKKHRQDLDQVWREYAVEYLSPGYVQGNDRPHCYEHIDIREDVKLRMRKMSQKMSCGSGTTGHFS